jgi:hypothetical protein
LVFAAKVLITDQLDLAVAIGVAALPMRRRMDLQVGSDVRRGDAHRQGNLQRLEAFAGEKDHPREMLQIALDGMQGMVDLAGDLQGLAAAKPVANGHPLV